MNKHESCMIDMMKMEDCRLIVADGAGPVRVTRERAENQNWSVWPARSRTSGPSVRDSLSAGMEPGKPGSVQQALTVLTAAMED